MRSVRCALRLVAAFAACAQAGPLPAPELKPVPSSAEHARLIDEGTRLHDERDYDGAIARYRQVLAANPHDALALYELSFSLFAKKDYRGCIDAGLRGARYDSPYLPKFYNTIGNCYDGAGEPARAIEVYQAAIEKLPSDHLLNFNLGLTYIRTNQAVEARKVLKRAATLSPNHASSHFYLGRLYARSGYRVPAVLAFWRFLVLEPASARSETAIQEIQSSFDSLVKKEGPTKTSIRLTPDGRSDEGDLMGLELAVAMALIGDPKSSKKPAPQPKSEAERLIESLDLMLTLLDEQNRRKQAADFVHAHYLPYFSDLKRHDYVAPFVYYAYQSRHFPGGTEWLRDNGAKVADFLMWSSQYRWQR